MIDEVAQYTDGVLSGEIPSGLHLRNAVARFVKDIKASENPANGWHFREEAVSKVIKFIGKLKHFTGDVSGKKFILQPWQMFIVANLYGFYNTDGTRRFQTAYIEMARKQGKTALVAALSLYHLVSDGEDGGEILFTANSLDQAKIGFRMVSGYANGLHNLKQRFKEIFHDDSSSFIRVLAADSSKLDGYNCSMGVVDEYHSAPTSQVRDVLRSSMGMRINPLLITITTAGFDKNLPCYELRTVCTDILSGSKKDDSFFGVIYSLDEEDDWKDPRNWIKSNPNLNVTVKESFIEKQVLQAVNSPADEVGVKTKNLNMWCDSATTWIPDEYIINASKPVDDEVFSGEDVYMGVDLASNVDLTAVSYLCVKDGIYYFKNNYYIPADTIHTKVNANMDYYREWVFHKYLKTTPGNVTDYSYITKEILDMSVSCSIEDIFYDKYNATAWVQQCTDAGLNMTPFSQTIGNFNNATCEFERLMLSGKIIMDDNPITRYCIRNVEMRMDFNGNRKPMKDSDRKKIDGVIAMLQALAAWIEATSEYKGTQIF